MPVTTFILHTISWEKSHFYHSAQILLLNLSRSVYALLLLGS